MNKDEGGVAEPHYVTQEMADVYNSLKAKPEDRNNAFDRALSWATRAALVGDFAPHSLRLLFQTMGRYGQSGQSKLNMLSYLGSIPATIREMMNMRKPFGTVLQIMNDRYGANTSRLYGIPEVTEQTSKIGKLLSKPNEWLRHPDYGVDVLARRVVGKSHLALQQEIGEDLGKIEADVNSGKMTTEAAVKMLEDRLGEKGTTDYARKVNNTLGWSNKQSRSQLLNSIQRFFPYVSSESGMVVDEGRKLFTLNLPKELAGTIQAGQYKRALLQAGGALATGPVGTVLMLEALNYVATSMWGKPKTLDQNDEGHKMDPAISPGWHITNLDPTFARPMRITGLKSVVNKGGFAPGREMANEAFATLNPAIRLAFSLLTGKSTYITESKNLMDARGGWWWPMGAGRQTVQSIAEGKGALPGAIQDVTSLTTGLRVQPSTGRNYSEAERQLHQLAQAKGASYPATPESKARHSLIDSIRATPADRSKLIDAAVKAGTIRANQRAEVASESRLTPFQIQIKHGDLPDVMKVWPSMTADEKKQTRLLIQAKINGNRTASNVDRQRWRQALTKDNAG